MQNLKFDNPKGQSIEICLDRSELDIQFILCKRLNNLGYKTFNNCSIYISKLIDKEYIGTKIDKQTRKKIYIDILVVHKNGLVLIEMKKKKAKNNKTKAGVRAQVNKYETIGFPVLLCEGMNDLNSTIKDVKRLLNKFVCYFS